MAEEYNWEAIDLGSDDAAHHRQCIAILPMGAHEHHGPHLPFETDSIIADGVAARLVAAIDGRVPICVLPTERTGYSIEHMDYAGTRSLSYSDAIERWISIGEVLHSRGIRKFLLLNAHGGNSPLLTIVATELRVRFNMLCVVTSWTRFIQGGSALTTQEKQYGIHGGDLETSVMLVLASDMVEMARAEHHPSKQAEFAQSFEHLRAYGPHAFGWKMQDLNPEGVVGDSTIATAEKGEALLNEAVSGLVSLVNDIDQADPDTLFAATPSPSEI